MLGLELVVIIPQKFPGKLRAIEQEVAVFLHSQQSNNLSTVARVVELITTELDDPTTLEKFRVRSGDWTRKANLTFARVIWLILQGHHQSLQNNLNDFYKKIGAVQDVPTAAAYCQARQKVKPEIFEYLNQQLLESFYHLFEEEQKIQRWKGHRLIALDGSYINLPSSQELRDKYSVQTNQYETCEQVQALGSFLYDLLNDVALSVALSHKQAEKKFLFDKHWKCLKESDCLILDRLYADSSVMSFLIHHKTDFIIRLKKLSFPAVDAFWASNQTDCVVEIEVSSVQKKWVKEQGYPTRLRIRLIKVELPDGEIEVLGTSLLNPSVYPAQEFGEVYRLRWRVETYLDRLKNIFELQRFGGKSTLTVEQDFYSLVFLANLESILTREAELEISIENQHRGRRYQYQVNHSVSYAAVRNYLPDLFLSSVKNREKSLEELKILFKKNTCAKRPNRKFPRKKTSSTHKFRYWKYDRRLIA
jgi:hypothetical protein